MARLINTENANRERQRLSRCIILALRELMKQNEPDVNSLDLASFIGLSLLDIYQTVENSISAWEKKGYWLKADRYHLEWLWSQQLGEKLCQSVKDGDWAVIAQLSAAIGQKLNKVKLPQRHRLGTPWIGAWDLLKSKVK